MLERIKGVLFLLPLIFVLLIGGNLLSVTGFIISLLGIYELYTVFKTKGYNPNYSVAAITCMMILLNNILKPTELFSASVLFMLFIYFSVRIIFNKNSIFDLAITILGVVYIAIPFDCIVKAYNFSTQDFNLVWLIFLIAFSNDICAYLIGKKFGKKKLIPSVSPNKTIEGSLGGILGSVIISSIIALIFNLEIGMILIIAIIGSILAQIGDLFASSIKRYGDIKDFSNIIPGHGGIIDRFDSILFVSPLIYIVMKFIYMYGLQ